VDPRHWSAWNDTSSPCGRRWRTSSWRTPPCRVAKRPPAMASRVGPPPGGPAPFPATDREAAPGQTGYPRRFAWPRQESVPVTPETDCYRIVASPVVAGDMVYAPTRVRPMLALRTGGRGDVTQSHLFEDRSKNAWTSAAPRESQISSLTRAAEGSLRVGALSSPGDACQSPRWRVPVGGCGRHCLLLRPAVSRVNRPAGWLTAP
jgi:hypothetical protein